MYIYIKLCNFTHPVLLLRAAAARASGVSLLPSWDGLLNPTPQPGTRGWDPPRLPSSRTAAFQRALHGDAAMTKPRGGGELQRHQTPTAGKQECGGARKQRPEDETPGKGTEEQRAARERIRHGSGAQGMHKPRCNRRLDKEAFLTPPTQRREEGNRKRKRHQAPGSPRQLQAGGSAGRERKEGGRAGRPGNEDGKTLSSGVQGRD